MNGRKTGRKLISFILSLAMMVTLVPATVMAAPATDKDSTAANVEKVLSYAAQMREENQKDDLSEGPFTWDTEGKMDTWRYFNGLMMDAFLMTGDVDNATFAEQFYRDNIKEDGSIPDFAEGELDAVESARGMFDLLGTAADSTKYAAAIQFVYSELEKQTTYEKCGGNYLHKQENDGTPTSSWSDWNIGLDGIYMAEPFLMECANAIDDGKLILTDAEGEAVSSSDIYQDVYERIKWVESAMIDADTGLYHHGWNVENMKGNGHFWLRGIGWYAMALVDVIEMMPESEHRTDLISYLPAFFDTMIKYQDADTGMWYNVVNRNADLSGNRLETSGSAMMAYALMKAYNNGYVADAKYGEAGLKAFNGIADNKISGQAGGYSIKDIYQKSGVGDSDSYYCTNPYTDDEAKGTGALIMAATLAKETTVKLPVVDEPDVPQPPAEVTDGKTGITVSGTTATAINAEDMSGNATVAAALTEKLETGFKAYDIDLEGYTQGTEAAVTMPAPAGADTVYYVSDDGTTVEEIAGAKFQDGTVTFKTTHFSIFAAGQAKAGGEEPAPVPGENTVTGNLQGETRYELDTDGVDNGANYLILNNSANGSSRYAFRNNDGFSARQKVTVSNGVATISENEEACVWTFNRTGGDWNISNGSQYLRLDNSDIISGNQAKLQVANRGEGGYRISFHSGRTYYLRYNNTWQRSTTGSNVYLFRQVAMPGASVSFSVIPDSASLQTGAQMNLTPTVLVDGAAATDCEITWTSENDGIATVENGTVAGVSDGTVNITATLTAANGTAMQEDLTITIPVTVSSKTVTSAVLTGNTTRYTKQNVEPDFGGIVLQVTYGDGTTAEITTANGLQISGYDVSQIGTQTARITYLGQDYGTVVVVVEGNPYAGLTPAEDYPMYPDDGAVRINKTAIGQDFNSTGAVKVELDVAGISVKSGVDVVLVVDVSNSMGWSLENSQNSGDINKMPTGNQSSKIRNAMDAAGNFADILLGDNDGSDVDNTLSFVTFAGYDRQHSKRASDQSTYIDSVMTVFTGVDNAENAKTSFNGTDITGEPRASESGDTGVDYTLTITGENGNQVVKGINRGNTNYDYAFWQAQQAVQELQQDYQNTNGVSYAQSGRETYVVFMTDGAPSHYNNKNANGGDDRDYYPGQKRNTYTEGNYDTDSWTNYLLSTDNVYANELYQKVGGNFYSIGFDLANGGFGDFSWTNSWADLENVLAGMVANQTIPVMTTADRDELNAFYQSLAMQIKYAGTNARVTDIIKSDFTLLTTQTTGTAGGTQGTLTSAPVIEVRAYDLWTKADTSDENLIGTRKDGGTALETVTFSGDGQQAFSDKIGNGQENIMSIAPDGSVTIAAQSFTYTKDASGTERFVWNIGNITDQEVALSYYAYLKGSMEGDRDGGVYDTNESAVLEYVDINGDFATQTFPLPKVNWQGAITTIQYYLVNEEGYPVNENGVVIPFANRVVVGQGATRTFNLNDSLTINGAGYTPGGYVMYNQDARYTVQANSDGTGSLTIDDNKTISGSKEVTTRRFDEDEDNYTATAVAFGVIFKGEPVEKTPLQADQIVIDYGKAVQVDVTANETTSDSTTYEVVGFMQYNPDTDTSLTQFADGTKTFNADNGQFTITEDGKVQYQLNRMLSEVERIFVVVKVAPDGDEQQAYRMLNELDIIPATTVYYETDFADGVFTFETTDKAWEEVTERGDIVADNLQDDGTIGQNLYGYDSSYANDKYQSNASSWFVTGADAYDPTATTSEFSFRGTGFDIISRTDTDEGFIRVSVYSDADKTQVEKRVTVLNKSESALRLYQIPVVSVENLGYGTHYVEIEVYGARESEEYPALSNGGQFHFDAVRIYNPVNASASASANSDAGIAYAAYVADGEADASVQEVRNMLIAADTFDETADPDDPDYVPGVSFIDRTQDGAGLADYKTLGPNNEVYLTGDQYIGFKVQVENGALPASIDIGAKSADGNPVTLHTMILNADFDLIETAETTVEINSSTAQFYDLMGMSSAAEAFGENNFIYVLIDNYGDGVLSITDLKIASGSTAASAQIISDKDTVEKATAYVNSIIEKGNESENYDVLSAAFTAESIKRNKTATMTVTTSEAVESLQVQNVAGREVAADIVSEAAGDGTKIWTVTFKVTSVGNQKFTVTGYGADGTAGTPAEAGIKVTVR